MSARYALTLLLICTALVALEIPGYLERSDESPAPQWDAVLLVAAVRWYSWMAAVPFADRVARTTGARSRQSIGLHAAVAGVFIVVHNVLVDAAVYSAGWDWEPPQWRSVIPRIVPDALLYTALATGLTVIESRRRRVEADARLRAALAEARLDALRQQLNPHFLFNALNHIVMQLRLNETPEALRMLLSLSDLLHLVLADRTQLTTVGREMEGVELYLAIERARFGEKLQVEVSLDAHVLDALVPSFMLQPLLENALRHGVSPVDGRCHVRLAVRADARRLLIEVRDEGPGPASAAPGSGIGLANTRERLKHLYEGDHHFELRPRGDAGAVVTVDIPLRKA